MSSSDPSAAEYFEWFLVDQLNLSPEKIDARWSAMREAMKESLAALVQASSKSHRRNNGGIMHPAVMEARDILHEMRLDDQETEARKSGPAHKPLAKLLAKQTFFLDVEEYTLRSEFMAFRRDTPGPNGRCSSPTPRPVCPSLILSLRIYHDGLLSVDSKHAFQPLSRPPSSNKRQRDSLQQQLRNKRFPSNIEAQGSSMSFLERQFLDAMQIRPSRYRAPIEHDIELSRLLDSYNPDYDASLRDSQKGDAISVSISPKSRSGSIVSNVSFQHPAQVPIEFPRKEVPVAREYITLRRASGTGSDKSEASTIGKVTRKNTQFTWKGDWETEDEEEFYREALKYNPSR